MTQLKTLEQTAYREKLIYWLRERSMWDGMIRLIDAANMLEADGKAHKLEVNVPLTDKQIKEITADNSLDTIHAVVRAIEAHHRIGVNDGR